MAAVDMIYKMTNTNNTISPEVLLMVSLIPKGVTRQAMYCSDNVTIMHVLATIIALEKQNVLHIVSVCLCVALVIQHAKRMCHTVIDGLSRSTIFFHIIS
jgi:hypothetical protein